MKEPAPTDEVWTVQRILGWTTNYLAEAGVESARLDAELLCAHARQCQRIRLYTDYDVPLTEVERSRMRESVQRRANREPLAYITGKREFYGRSFEVGAGVMIPRPETETLVDLALEQIPDDRPSRFIEVGFGSGCIAVTLAIQKPRCQIGASDISDACCEYARRNADAHGVADRIQFVHGDGLSAVRHLLKDSVCDGLVCNPPYICEHEFCGLQPEVAGYEPREALLSGVDGLNVIRQLMPESACLLRSGGWIGLECDPAQCIDVSQLMKNVGFTEPQIHRDYRDTDRIVTAINGK